MRSAPNLEVDFVAAEFVVAEVAGRIVGCARLKPLRDGGFELASVVVDAAHRRTGVATLLVKAALKRGRGLVHALALAPRFFEGVGFVEVPPSSLPASLKAKAEGMCASTGFVAMRRLA